LKHVPLAGGLGADPGVAGEITSQPAWEHHSVPMEELEVAGKR